MADQSVHARTFSEPLTLVAGLLCLEKRVSYWRLLNEFDLEDEILNDRRADIGSQVHAYERNYPGRPRIDTLYGRPEVAGDQMAAAMRVSASTAR
jgi:hypothetical protein